MDSQTEYSTPYRAVQFLGSTSSSHVEYVFSQTGFEISSMTARDGSLDSLGNAQGVIYFSVSTNTPYTLSGNIATVDPSAKFVSLAATLSDVDTLDVLFNNDQSTFGVANQSFQLGEANGVASNDLSGSLSGTLLAGHRYQFNYGNSIYASSAGTDASATGSFMLTVVPEPSAFAFLGLVGLVAYGFNKLKKRHNGS